MKILLTGANGYIGKRLLPVLIDQGHEVICCVRNKRRFDAFEKYKNRAIFYELDFLNETSLEKAPKDIDLAFYLIHSMSGSRNKFEKRDAEAANNFVNYINKTSAKQIIYLTGIVNEKNLSPHLRSRKQVEEILKTSTVSHTILRAAIIVGSGSASFEIIRDLVEKLPVMVAPKWVNTKVQPIGVSDVIKFLSGVMLNEKCYNKIFDICGPEILTYKEMLLQYGEQRKLKRKIFTVPIMTPRLSSYWLYFLTSTSYNLAVNLVESMKVEMICNDDSLSNIINVMPITYKEAVQKAFHRIEENMVVSSWKDSFISSTAKYKMMDDVEAPAFGVIKEIREVEIIGDVNKVKEKIWSIGGETGWYYADFLWRMRGFIDRLFGGVGLRRGRTHRSDIYSGDALDFWRVILSDKDSVRLLLYSEMKLPGEAWLEWRIIDKDHKKYLKQTATFRPKGLLGRAYWYSLLPIHFFLFDGMAKAIARN